MNVQRLLFRRLIDLKSIAWAFFFTLMFIVPVVASTPFKKLVPQNRPISFKLVDNNVILVPVKLNDKIETTFIFDTGGGVNVVSEKLAKALNLKKLGSYSGKRMSGQELTMSLSKVSSLSFGSLKKKNVNVAKWNLKDFLPDTDNYKNVEGVLSLNYFTEVPFTLNYRNRTITVENPKTLQANVTKLNTTPIKVVTKKNVDTAIFLPVSLSDKEKALVEVDTGSNHFILDTSYMKKLGVSPNDAGIVKRVGKDQTDHPYTRYHIHIPGSIWVSKTPTIKQLKPNVMFQKIIYDGLVGKDFLKNFVTTFDLKNKRMIFQ